MPKKQRRRFGIFFCVLLIGGIALVGFVFLKMNRIAASSAERALAAEVVQVLSSIPKGELYPTSLSNLSLTYPDGGNPSLLKIFDYQSTGTKCVLRIRFSSFDTQEIVQYFP